MEATIPVRVPGQKHSPSAETKGVRVPQLPRKVREDIRLSPSEVEEMINRNPIMPPKYGEFSPEHVTIIPPDLLGAKYLQSKHTTPADSLE